MNHHSNSNTSQHKTPQTGGSSFGNNSSGHPQNISSTSAYRPNIPRTRLPIVPIKSNNYRQIPVRTDEVSKQLEDLKNKFTPHLVKQSTQQIPQPQAVTVKKVVRQSQPILQNIIPQTVPNRTQAVINPVRANSNQPLFNLSPSQPSNNQTFQNPAPSNFSRPKLASKNPLEINKIYSKDYQQKILPRAHKAILPTSKFYQNKPTKNRFLSRIKGKRVVASILMFLISATIFGISGFVYYQRAQSPTSAVAGVVENKIEFPKLEEYKTWITDKSGSYAEPQEDLDGDELNNYEEFILNSDPLSANTCNPETTDSQNLFAFIDPATCKPIDFTNPDEAEKFDGLISFPNLQQGFLEDVVVEQETAPAANSNSLLSLFEVQSYSQLDSITTESLDTQLAQKTTKKEYLRLVGRIDDYIKQYRSYEALDRNYAAPVHPAVFLDVSLKYQVPLKYTLAIARTESRFGTDRYTNDGGLTRPGQYQNIYSMGLTDGGQNLKFNNWEAGVESFGKWYKKFQDRGVSNCAKWRIYNPNGDYCSKIEALAATIDIYLQSN